jgi:Zn-dependent oligopeptidase
LFERLALDPAVIRRIARHYQTDAPIPDSLIAQIATFGPNGALITGHWRSLMSLALHEGPPRNIDSIVRATFAEAQPRGPPLLALPEASIHPEQMFFHLATYEAGFTPTSGRESGPRSDQSFEHGLLDTAMTHRYRARDPGAGGSRSAIALVESFLGRPFSLDAWAATIRKATAGGGSVALVRPETVPGHLLLNRSPRQARVSHAPFLVPSPPAVARFSRRSSPTPRPS